MTVYTEMNNKIVDLLRMGDTPVELYAAQRIEELELKNKELIERVLEIIDKERDSLTRTANIDEEYVSACTVLIEIRKAVFALKGEQE